MKVLSLIILLISFKSFADLAPVAQHKVVFGRQNFDGQVLKNSLCQYCQYSGSSFKKAKIEQGYCKVCDYSDISGEYLEMKAFTVDHSLFRRAQLQNADLSALRAYFAIFDDANLQNAQLWGADLRYSSFRRTDLRGADLSMALVHGAEFQGAIFDEKTKLPFSKEKALKMGMRWQP